MLVMANKPPPARRPAPAGVAGTVPDPNPPGSPVPPDLGQNVGVTESAPDANPFLALSWRR